MVELRINSGGKLPNFGFVVFDDPEPVQKILANKVWQLLLKQRNWFNSQNKAIL